MNTTKKAAGAFLSSTLFFLIGFGSISVAAPPPPSSKTSEGVASPVVVIKKPDLIVESLNVTKVGGDKIESILNVTVTVKNVSSGPNSAPTKHRVKVLLEWEGTEGKKTWEATIPARSLKVDESGTAVFNDCRIRAHQTGKFRATVDPLNEIEEWSEGNNTKAMPYEDKP